MNFENKNNKNVDSAVKKLPTISELKARRNQMKAGVLAGIASATMGIAGMVKPVQANEVSGVINPESKVMLEPGQYRTEDGAELPTEISDTITPNTPVILQNNQTETQDGAELSTDSKEILDMNIPIDGPYSEDQNENLKEVAPGAYLIDPYLSDENTGK